MKKLLAIASALICSLAPPATAQHFCIVQNGGKCEDPGTGTTYVEERGKLVNRETNEVFLDESAARGPYQVEIRRGKMPPPIVRQVAEDDEPIVDTPQQNAARARPRIGINPTTGEIYPAVPGGAINTTTGEFYPGAAGGIINPRSGQFYPDVGGGYINPANGQFIPKQ